MAALLIFLAAVASLLLVTLPFASERPIAIDHPLAYLILIVVMLIGYALRLADLFGHSLLPWPPQRGIGVWLIAAGFVLFARGAFEVFEAAGGSLAGGELVPAIACQATCGFWSVMESSTCANDSTH